MRTPYYIIWELWLVLKERYLYGILWTHRDPLGPLAGKRTHIDSDGQASGFEDGETNTDGIQPFGQELDAETLTDVSGKVAIGVQFSEGGDQEVVDDLKQTSPRF